MVLLEALAVVVVLGLLVYGTAVVLMRPTDDRPRAITAGEWRVAHYDAAGATRVVVQRVDAGGAVLDEHLVDTVGVEDPAYDERFLEAMAVARRRRALFEAEGDG